jgi:hypothetical protein
MSWHIDAETLGQYAVGSVAPAVAASTEAHLTGCADCRASVASGVPAARLDAIWVQVDDRVHLATRPVVERVLSRVGLREDTARLLVVTPSLRGAWLLAVLLSAGLAAFAADASGRGVALFLAFAPLLPVAGVALAYGPAADPVHEITMASPYSMLRLVLLRSVAVVASSVVLTAFGGLLLAGSGWSAAAWLLPALALSALTLVLSVNIGPGRAGVGVAVSWLMAVLAGAWTGDGELWVVGVAGQTAALLLLAAGVIMLRRVGSRLGYDTGSAR